MTIHKRCGLNDIPNAPVGLRGVVMRRLIFSKKREYVNNVAKIAGGFDTVGQRQGQVPFACLPPDP